MTNKKEKLIILGKSGSGKDYLMRKLVEKGLKPCLKWTTRPARKYEQHGVTYNFVTDTQFIQSINENSNSPFKCNILELELALLFESLPISLHIVLSGHDFTLFVH